MKEHLSETTPFRIDNPLNSPVSFDRGTEDLFDFLRAGEAFDVDAEGCVNSYAAVARDHRQEVKTL